MDMITVTAKTLDEAITKALIELGTTSDNLEYVVVEKGSAGIFGLFGKNVVIRAKKKKEDDLDEFFRTGDLDKIGKAPKEEKPVKPEPKAPEKKEAPKKEQPVRESREPKKEVPKKENRQPKPEMREKKQPRREKPERSFEEKTAKAEAALREEKRDERKEDRRPINVEVCTKAAEDFLNKVFAAMDMSVSLKTEYNDKERELTVNMAGDDMGILIGKRGQTLDSLQYLVSLVVNKECEGYLRVKLDTENYRCRRKDTLETLARNIAYKVKRTRRSVSLEPMNPYERRIIHAALQNDRYVVTRSEGEEPFRHVVISLKRERNSQDRNNRSDRNGRQERNWEKNAEKRVSEQIEETPVSQENVNLPEKNDEQE